MSADPNTSGRQITLACNKFVRGWPGIQIYPTAIIIAFFNLGGPMWQALFQSGGTELDNQVVKNNIVYKGRQNPQNARHHADIFIPLTLDGKVLGANRIVSNSFMKDTAGDSEVFVDTLGNQSLAWMESNHLNNFSDNLQVDPKFVSSNPQAPEDFELQSKSPMIDAGAFLTITAGSGTRITVADSRYFFDGFGIVDGDRVQIESNAPVRITDVNYSNHVITVDQSITRGSGNGVSLPYNGSAPDIGAWESGAGSAPDTRSSVTAARMEKDPTERRR